MKYKFLIIILFFLFIPTINASTARISISNSKSTVLVGSTLRTTVTVSSNSYLGVFEFDLKYDTTRLRLTNSSAGGTSILGPSDINKITKTDSYTFDFVARTSGSASIYIANSTVYDIDENKLSVTNGSSKVTVMTQSELEATYSKNNFLKSLSIENYQLEPEFEKETLEYSVTLAPETTKINIIGEIEDAKASVMGLGEIDVVDGLNKIEIIVTAQNGNQRTYIINALVEELNPIEIEVDGQKYNLIRKTDQITCPSLFLIKTIEYKEEEIPACFNEKNDLTLLVVRDEELRYFVLDSLIEYREIKNKLFVFFNLEFPEDIIIPDGYQKVKLTIDGHEVNGYRNDQFQDFYLIYGINIETGNKGIYQYDQKENTMQRFNFEIKDEQEENHNLLAIIFASTTLILLVTTATMALKKKKNRVNRQKDLLL